LSKRKKYAKYGVHKGMSGVICHPERVNGMWLVSFEQYGELPEIACISAEETDLVVLDSPSEYDVTNNTRIAKYWAERRHSSSNENEPE
jgi:hypothetical protein